MNVMSELQNFSVIRNHMEQKFTVMLGGGWGRVFGKWTDDPWSQQRP